jgi:hypothetical protein
VSPPALCVCTYCALFVNVVRFIVLLMLISALPIRTIRSLSVTDGVTVKNYYKKKIKNGPRGCVLCPTTNIQLFHQKKIKSSQVHPKSKVHPVSRTGTHGHHMCSHCHSAFSSHVSDLSCLEMPPLTLRMPPGRRARSQRAAAHPCTRLVSGLGLQDAGPWRSSTQSIVWSKTNVWFVNCAYAS